MKELFFIVITSLEGSNFLGSFSSSTDDFSVSEMFVSIEECENRLVERFINKDAPMFIPDEWPRNLTQTDTDKTVLSYKSPVRNETLYATCVSVRGGSE